MPKATETSVQRQRATRGEFAGKPGRTGNPCCRIDGSGKRELSGPKETGGTATGSEAEETPPASQDASAWGLKCTKRFRPQVTFAIRALSLSPWVKPFVWRTCKS